MIGRNPEFHLALRARWTSRRWPLSLRSWRRPVAPRPAGGVAAARARRPHGPADVGWNGGVQAGSDGRGLAWHVRHRVIVAGSDWIVARRARRRSPAAHLYPDRPSARLSIHRAHSATSNRNFRPSSPAPSGGRSSSRASPTRSRRFAWRSCSPSLARSASDRGASSSGVASLRDLTCGRTGLPGGQP